MINFLFLVHAFLTLIEFGYHSNGNEYLNETEKVKVKHHHKSTHLTRLGCMCQCATDKLLNYFVEILMIAYTACACGFFVLQFHFISHEMSVRKTTRHSVEYIDLCQSCDKNMP